MLLELRPLPYPVNALEPFLGAETLRVRREKHHAGYCNERKRYVEACLEHLVDWDFVAANLAAESARAQLTPTPRHASGARGA